MWKERRGVREERKILRVRSKDTGKNSHYD